MRIVDGDIILHNRIRGLKHARCIQLVLGKHSFLSFQIGLYHAIEVQRLDENELQILHKLLSYLFVPFVNDKVRLPAGIEISFDFFELPFDEVSIQFHVLLPSRAELFIGDDACFFEVGITRLDIFHFWRCVFDCL